jgi:ATP-dependent helicase STH1/SNF2
VLLTTYEYIIKDKAFLSKIKWLYMIIDEGHRMKNSQSKLTNVLTSHYSARHRLILTGTPLQNNLPELWALLNFVLPKIFNSSKGFDEWFNAPFANTGEKLELNEEETLLIIRRLHKVLRPFLLRRLKKDVEAELPDKIERIIKVPMSSLQSRLYTNIKQKTLIRVDSNNPNAGIRRFNNTIMQLRKICNHPFVFEEVEKQVNPCKINNDLLFRVSGKFELLKRILPKFKVSGHRVLIFFQMTTVMTVMEDFLTMEDHHYIRLDGSTKSEDRSELLKKFNAPNSPYFIFLLSTRAGGLGLNLQSADTVIIFDSDWNPHQDLQAQDRAHRIGQTKEVRIFRLVTIDSVEEVILAKAQYKLNLDGKIIQAGKFDHKSTNEEREAMLRAIFETEQDQKHDESDDEIFGDDELNEIIARGEAELELFQSMDAKAPKTKKSRLIEEKELPAVYLNEYIFEEDEQIEYGKGQRTRKVINYDDGLSESKWLKRLEYESEEEEESENEHIFKDKKIKSKKQKIFKGSEDEPFIKEEEVEDLRENANYFEAPSPASLATPLKMRGRPSLKKKIDPLNETQRQFLQFTLYQLYQKLLAHTDTSGRVLSLMFQSLPSKSIYPDYYAMITTPISLTEIKRKIDTFDYHHLDSFIDDIQLMCNNARKYNMDTSIIYQDAVQIYVKNLLNS